MIAFRHAIKFLSIFDICSPWGFAQWKHSGIASLIWFVKFTSLSSYYPLSPFFLISEIHIIGVISIFAWKIDNLCSQREQFPRVKNAVSYRCMVFPVEFKVHVALFFHEVIGDWELVIIQQFTFASILHLVGLASASLMEAFHKTVKRFVYCEVLEAVSH